LALLAMVVAKLMKGAVPMKYVVMMDALMGWNALPRVPVKKFLLTNVVGVYVLQRILLLVWKRLTLVAMVAAHLIISAVPQEYVVHQMDAVLSCDAPRVSVFLLTHVVVLSVLKQILLLVFKRLALFAMVAAVKGSVAVSQEYVIPMDVLICWYATLSLRFVVLSDDSSTNIL
jgi:hypothetical protein